MLNKSHEKLITSVRDMLIDGDVNMPYYGNFALHINYVESKKLDTCGVTVNTKGMFFYYNSDFLDRMTQKMVNFVNIHELYHLLFSHHKRTKQGGYDHKLSNIVQDWIINHLIVEHIPENFIEIPKYGDGTNLCLFVPEEYDGKLIFEHLYEWAKDKKEEWEENGKQITKPRSGMYGKDPKNGNGKIETASMESIFDNIDKNNGCYLDSHIDDDISPDLREAMVRGIMDKLAARGLGKGTMEGILNKLRRKKKDYTREIKIAVSSTAGCDKEKTISRPNRRDIQGVKGFKKSAYKMNVGLDTSGSMTGQDTFEKVMSYVYRSEILMNFVQCDTEIAWVGKYVTDKEMEKMKIFGGGGTTLQPMVDYLVKNHNDCGTVLLTDGYTDSLDLSGLKHKVLIISIGTPCPIARSNGKLKQITVDNDNDE